MNAALIQNITSSVILKLTLNVHVPFWVCMLLQVMTMSRRFSGKEKKMLESDEKELKV